MSFIAKSPLTIHEFDAPPSDVYSVPDSGTRGLFATKNGWHDVDSDGNIKQFANEEFVTNNFANAVKATINPMFSVVTIDDISPFEHFVKVKIMSAYPEVVDTRLLVSDDNGLIATYTPNSDGTVDNVLSVAPKMILSVESSRAYDYPVFSEIEYNQDLNKTLSAMNDATEELQKLHTAELIETIVADGTISIYERNTDASGNNYQFKSMYIHIAIKPTVLNRIEVDFYDSENIYDVLKPAKRLCAYQFSNTVGNNGFMSIHADVIGGMWQAIATSASNQGSPTGVTMWGEKKLEPYNGESIKYIVIKGATSAIASGATITIYGVR